MIFQKAKGIEAAFRHIKIFTIVVISSVTLLCAFVCYNCFRMSSLIQQKIYVLANGKALEAFSGERKDNLPVEARDHIKTFHQLFFSLSPDENAIKSSLNKSFYLADASAKREYDNFMEANYYSNIVTANIIQTVQVDSISLDVEQTPYYFKCYAKQQVTRPTSSATRSLITEGYLREVSRSNNNSHGFLIERWRILDNRDIDVKMR